MNLCGADFIPDEKLGAAGDALFRNSLIAWKLLSSRMISLILCTGTACELGDCEEGEIQS